MIKVTVWNENLHEKQMPEVAAIYPNGIHGAIAEALAAAGLEYEHEYRLGPRRRIDFRVGRIGIEVKKGRPASSALAAQLRKYLESDELDAVIVVTQRVTRVPNAIDGKPVRLLSLNRLWGVALP